MLVALAFALTLVRPFNFYGDGPYDASTPKPESLLGFGPGERHSTFRDQERVVLAIAQAAKDRVRMFEYGKSTEGRPLRVFAVSSPANIKRLETIQKQHKEIAEGHGDPASTVPIVWINECIHGDETASFESGMWTLYNLAASRGSLAKALEHEVVIFNPVYNPDGHERYVVYYNSIAVGSSDPDSYEHRGPEVMMGRLNHYRFDMNRDRVAFSQDETREEFAEMLRWNPQVYIDQHGQVGSYFFPPEPMSINANVDRVRNAKWTDIFGRAIGGAFDENGMSYFVKDEFDLYYPGYIDSSNTLTGAIGMTHETDGGRVLAEERADGSTVTLRQGMSKHFTSALTVVKTASAHGADLMADYAKFKKAANTGAAAGKFKRVVLSGDPRALERLSKQLSYGGIESQWTEAGFDQEDAHNYWSTGASKHHFDTGSLVVDLSQPQGALAKALLEPSAEFEPEFIKEQVARRKSAPEGETYPGPDGAEFYDVTAWSLPLSHDLQAWWCESSPKVSQSAHRPTSTNDSPRMSGSVAYALPYHDDEDALAVFEALGDDVRASVSSKAMSIDGHTFRPGTFFFSTASNDDGFESRLAKAAMDHSSGLISLHSTYPDSGRDSLGSESMTSLRKPKIAVVMGNPGSLTDCSGIWYLLERVWKLPFTPVTTSFLSSGDLSKYTCIILPRGASAPSSGKFHDWISAGNVAVALSPNGVVGGGYVDLTEVSGKIASLPGSLFKAQMDPRSFLSFGYERDDKGGPITLAVPIEGERFYQTRKEGGSIVTLPGDSKEPLLLSGWEWPDDTEQHLKGTVFLQDVPVGRGHMVIYMSDPTARAMWPGLYRTLLNAILIGSAR